MPLQNFNARLKVVCTKTIETYVIYMLVVLGKFFPVMESV